MAKFTVILCLVVMYGCEPTYQEKVVVMDEHVNDYKRNKDKSCGGIGATMSGKPGMGFGCGFGPMIDLTSGELTFGFNY